MIGNLCLRSWKRMLASNYNPRRTITSKNGHCIDLRSQSVDYDATPPHLVASLQRVLKRGSNEIHQYARPAGQMNLVNTLSDLYSTSWNRKIDEEKEILIGMGSEELISNAVLAYCEPGDEIIVFEPASQQYSSHVGLVDAKLIPIALKCSNGDNWNPNDWSFDLRELKSAISGKSKMILLSNPNVPLGKLFNDSELEWIASVAREHNLLVISDETQAWNYLNTRRHRSASQLPGMWERTITVSSAGGMFQAPGWNCGWAIGPANLIDPLFAVHSYAIHSCPTLQQEAIAESLVIEVNTGIQSEKSYWNLLGRSMKEKRTKLVNAFNKVGLLTSSDHSGNSLLIEVSNINIDLMGIDPNLPWSEKVSTWLETHHKILTLPLRMASGKKSFILVNILRDDETINKSIQIIENLAGSVTPKNEKFPAQFIQSNL